MFSLKKHLKIKRILVLFFIFNLFSLNCAIKLNASSKKASTKIVKANNIQEESNWYEYEPKIVTLKGILIISTNYGSPCYGENPKEDKKITYYSLKLEKPINVKGDSNSDVNLDTFENLLKIQIVLNEPFQNIKDKINKKVTITGTLFQAITGHHYTSVLINAKKIELINKK